VVVLLVAGLGFLSGFGVGGLLGLGVAAGFLVDLGGLGVRPLGQQLHDLIRVLVEAVDSTLEVGLALDEEVEHDLLERLCLGHLQVAQDG